MASTSASTEPITPARFAAAIKDLELPTLRLKVLELRNSVAHLLYSNAELRPFVEGDAPDHVCAEAIRENEEVLTRMAERIALVRAEVEDRGGSWSLFEEDRRKLFEEDGSKKDVLGEAATAASTNGTASSAAGHGDGNTMSHPAWSDGTIQVGTMRLRGQADRPGAGNASGGGSLTDEELARRLQDRMRGLEDDDDDDGGMHL